MNRTRTWVFVAALGLLTGGGCKKNDGANAPGNKTEVSETEGQTSTSNPQDQKDQKEAFGRVTVAELEEKMNAAQAGTLKLAVYDANGRDTYAEGHLPGAVWVQYDELKASDLPADKDTQLVFYCYIEH